MNMSSTMQTLASSSPSARRPAVSLFLTSGGLRHGTVRAVRRAATMYGPVFSPPRDSESPTIANFGPLVLLNQGPVRVLNLHFVAFAVSKLTHGTLPWLIGASRQPGSIFVPPYARSTSTIRHFDGGGGGPF